MINSASSPRANSSLGRRKQLVLSSLPPEEQLKKLKEREKLLEVQLGINCEDLTPSVAKKTNERS